MSRPFRLFPLAIAALVFSAVACAPAPQPTPAVSAANQEAAPADKSAAGPEIVKLGTFFSMGAAPLFVAVERGFFTEQRVEVEIQRTAGASEVMGFLGAGHLDVAGGGVSAPLYNAVARGVPIKVVAPLGLVSESPEHASNFMMARKDLYDSGSVREVAQLRGRRIAITGLGSTNHWHLARLLRTANLRLGDVDVVDMNYADMITALATGNLDAAILASPYDVQLKKEGVAEMLVPNVAPGQMLTVLMFSPQFRDERPDAARRFMIAYANAIRAMQRDGDIFGDNLPIYEKYTGLKGEDILISTPPVFDANLRIDVKPLLEYQEFLIAEKSVTYPTPLTEDQLVDRSFADFALQNMSKQ